MVMFISPCSSVLSALFSRARMTKVLDKWKTTSGRKKGVHWEFSFDICCVHHLMDTFSEFAVVVVGLVLLIPLKGEGVTATLAFQLLFGICSHFVCLCSGRPGPMCSGIGVCPCTGRVPII